MGGSPADLKLLRKPNEVQQVSLPTQPLQHSTSAQQPSPPRSTSLQLSSSPVTKRPSTLLAALKMSPFLTSHKAPSPEGAGSPPNRPPRSPSTNSLLLFARNHHHRGRGTSSPDGGDSTDEEGGGGGGRRTHAPSKPGHKKSVSFSSLSIREFEVIIGDHPCCTRGVPLSLGWDYEETVADLPLDAYEEDRSPHRRPRCELRTTCEERRDRLHDTTTEGDLKRAQRKLHRVRSCSAKLCERANASFFEGKGSGVTASGGGGGAECAVAVQPVPLP